MNKTLSARRAVALLAAVAVAPSLWSIGVGVHNSDTPSWGISVAEAQPRTSGKGQWNRRDRDDDDDFRNGRRVDFEGRITKASRSGRGWAYTVRTKHGRNVSVRYHRQFRVGTKVEVEGTMRNNVVHASKMERDD